MMRKLLEILLLCTIVLSLSVTGGVQRAGAESRSLDMASTKLVMAHYLNHWATPQTVGGWDGWAWDGDGCGLGYHEPDRILGNGRRDIASVYYPLIGPYDVSDQAVLEYHIQLAKASGIDAFIIDWDGITHYEDFPRINSNFAAMLKLAERMNFSLAVDYDAHRYYLGQNGPKLTLFHNRAEALRQIQYDLKYVVQEFGQSHAYLKYNGLPVVFEFGGSSVMKGADWRRIFDALSSEGIHAEYFRFYFGGASYYPPFRGFAPWLEPGLAATGKTDPVTYIYGAADDAGSVPGLSFGGDPWPGFDSTPVGDWCYNEGPKTVGRGDGAVYNQTWRATMSVSSGWVDIATFNDWNEGTIVEPTLEFRYQYLYATAYYSSQFKHETSNYDGIPVPLAIYNATLTIRQAQHDGRSVGLESANETLQRAKQTFQSGQYSTALADANQAKQLADQATFPQASTTSVAAASTSQIPVSSSTGFSAPATALAVMVLVLVVISAVMIRIRKGNKGRV